MKTQQRFKSERHNVFTEEINEIAWWWKNAIIWFDRNIRTLNEQRSSKWKRRD